MPELRGDPRDHRGGSATCSVATFVQIPAASGGLVVANFNRGRNALTVFNAGATTLYVGYGTPAVSGAGMPIIASGTLYEPDFTGTVSLVSAGATQGAYVIDVGAP